MGDRGVDLCLAVAVPPSGHDRAAIGRVVGPSGARVGYRSTVPSTAGSGPAITPGIVFFTPIVWRSLR